MIDPDQINISLIPASQLSLLEIDTISKIKSENKILKNILIIISISAFIIAIKKYYGNEDTQKSNSI